MGPNKVRYVSNNDNGESFLTDTPKQPRIINYGKRLTRSPIGGGLKLNHLGILLISTLYLIGLVHGPGQTSNNLVYCWTSDDSGSAYHYNARPSSFWLQPPRQQFKRDSLTGNDGPDNVDPSEISLGGQPQVQNSGWLDIFGGLFPQASTTTRPTRPELPVDSLDNHVRNILIPRVSGTPGNVKVRNYIVNQLQFMNYHVTLDEFTDSTPIGRVPFANIIATSNPSACRQLAIACHHDSKMMQGFLGAVDSAVPCSMMLELANKFKNSFRSRTTGSGSDDKTSDLGLMFIFFDGEEAFHQWTDTDSLYGSRHLAAKWDRQSAPKHCGLKNELARLDLLMVLDLIGSSDTTFAMYSRSLKQHYQSLQRHEKNYLKDRRQLGAHQIRQATSFKSNYIPLEFLQDDHVPFYKRGVPILSLLASPFPSVWHTINDNYDAIDFPKTNQILNSIEMWIANYNGTTS